VHLPTVKKITSTDTLIPKRCSYMTEEPDFSHLREPFEALLNEADLVAWRKNDPVGIVWELSPDQQEVGALIASCLAYGRVKALSSAIRDVFRRLNHTPTHALLTLDLSELETRMSGFAYRMTRDLDLVDLLWGVRSVLLESESLESRYLQCDGSHLERASRLVDAIIEGRAREPIHRGLRYLLPNPRDGSPTKRLHLFFRWMVREENGVDLGKWSSVNPAHLLIPLDTHIGQMARQFELTNRKANDLKTVLEVTRALATIDPDDPTRYDFALCHLAISSRCTHRFDEASCPKCPAQQFCVFGRQG